MRKLYEIFRYAALDQNGALSQLLGMFPVIVLATSLKNGLVMGVFITLVLVLTSLTLSLLRNVLTESTRLCVSVLLIATESCALGLLMQGFFPSLFSGMQIFFEFLCVVGIIFARGEMYARFQAPKKALADALGTGAGFSAVLVILGFVRELLGGGTLFAGTPLSVSLPLIKPMAVFLHPAGGLILTGFLAALFHKKRKKMVANIENREEKDQ